MLKAEVTLANLRSNYKPPTAGMGFVAPGMITIPEDKTYQGVAGD
jgi:hypothetical protein